jgi:mannan endo-1,4-beta-mannosidase
VRQSPGTGPCGPRRGAPEGQLAPAPCMCCGPSSVTSAPCFRLPTKRQIGILRQTSDNHRVSGRLPGFAAALAAAVAVVLGLMPGVATARSARVALGAYIPHADQNPSLIDSFAGRVGWQPVIVSSFKTFDQAPVYYPQLEGIYNHGAVPMVTWEPQTSSGAGIDLANVARGRYDGYLRRAAQAAANWRGPLLMRFGEEMNGPWYAWSPFHGNSAHAFVAAWRHIVRLFRREGAGNVRWVWTPYVDAGHHLPFKRFYPGDRYVDWAGLDGYNWGGSFRWRSFRKLFAGSYHTLLRLTSRPLMIGEVGCGKIAGNRAQWLRQMFRHNLPQMTHIRAVVWFDGVDRTGDLQIGKSGSALNAFRQLTNAPLYTATRSLFLQTPERLGRVSGGAGR